MEGIAALGFPDPEMEKKAMFVKNLMAKSFTAKDNYRIVIFDKKDEIDEYMKGIRARLFIGR